MADSLRFLPSLLEIYRISTSPTQIADALMRSKDLQQSMMWQSNSDGKTIFLFNIEQLDLKKKLIVVNYNGEQELIDPDLPIFVKLYFRETLFKGKVLKIEMNKLTLSIPHEIHLREYRNSLRVVFGPGEESVELKVLGSALDPSKVPSLNAYLKDVSIKGLGLLISKNNSHLFKKGQILEIIGFSNLPLPKHIQGKVVYCIRFSVENRRVLYKVGIELTSKIPKEIFEQLIKDKKQNFQTTSRHLLESSCFDSDFQKNVILEMERVEENMRLIPEINQYLEVIRNQTKTDFYFSEHIKILIMVCLYIAKTMNWPHWANIEKFIHAALFHDSPFIHFPRLARIRNLKEFNLLKDQLSEEEKELFLSAPLEASKIARKLPYISEDVIEMISLQKELPSGKGFPQQMESKEIPAKAAFFILAHDLSHEIITNYDWTIERWLLRVQEEYSKGNFMEILKSISSSKERIIAHAFNIGSI